MGESRTWAKVYCENETNRGSSRSHSKLSPTKIPATRLTAPGSPRMSLLSRKGSRDSRARARKSLDTWGFPRALAWVFFPSRPTCEKHSLFSVVSLRTSFPRPGTLFAGYNSCCFDVHSVGKFSLFQFTLLSLREMKGCL